MKTEYELRKEIVRICRIMHERHYISASDGNVSCRLSGDRVLITPSGVNKGFISESDLVIYSLTKPFAGKSKISSEYKLHSLVYTVRPEVKCVIHAHPPLAISCSIAGVSLASCMLPEVIISLGKIPTSRYATPSTDDVPLAVQDYIRDYNAIILERHGSLTLGKTMMEAYNNLEKIEHTAEIVITSRLLGGAKPLPMSDVNRLLGMGRSFGLIKEGITCDDCGSCNRRSINEGSC